MNKNQKNHIANRKISYTHKSLQRYEYLLIKLNLYLRQLKKLELFNVRLEKYVHHLLLKMQNMNS